jgi:2-oxoglutarate dehydrogenase E2 component (dihydrolipoamide succinyltransferase)
MMIDILVPELPESVADASVAQWHKKPGDFIERDEVIVEIETDKVILEVQATKSGILETILEQEGEVVVAKQLLGRLKEADAPVLEAANEEQGDVVKPALEAEDETKSAPEEQQPVPEVQESAKEAVEETPEQAVMMREQFAVRDDKRVPMTRLRKRVAERLLEAKNATAMLTTFNEVNMKPIMELRKQYQTLFEEKHGVRLGLMSFYIKAVTEALQRFPVMNAAVDGDDIVYHNYFDISVAVATPRGLVTPVLQDTDRLSFAEIEQTIKAFAAKGHDGKLSADEMSGGNFTITNGGVFGSLLSTPIINPPQAAILGMHKIQDRPMAVDGKVEIRPMMYLALSYDHRLIDGKESVSFLVTIKELLEDPARLLLDV